ncbi:ribosome biogenesis GTP-binding protein YihA/YsxC [Sulfobacillus harzensis]|uniref:Probable GTP-binding protein EngB n=1 Tax=Sulfobacillus harzensis TaxID=2729629 RepID=A0A7Y0L2M3_9FIRM|nr:ribosome biogenesis GTP-binding protein YihA/YsxC [Sulfobacillus harzensis]NMP21255.1 ribosome biogenesis GTP-binding protein YsxC [Sulfobacillus harzensis]
MAKKKAAHSQPARGQHVASALDQSEMPTSGLPEVAFMGRSNAGKSSLINALVKAKVAHTSSTPGRTQRINFFQMPGWYIVDLPGFGYAKVSKAEREAFGQAVDQYLIGRQPLVAAVLIQDVRRDPEEEEAMLVHWAADRNILLVVAASKMDRLNRREQEERRQRLESIYGRPVFLISNRTGEGLDQVREALRGLGLSV